MKMEAAGSSVKFSTTYKTTCCQNQNATIKIRAIVWEVYFFVTLMMNVMWHVILPDSRVTLTTWEFLELLHAIACAVA